MPARATQYGILGDCLTMPLANGEGFSLCGFSLAGRNQSFVTPVTN